MKTKNVRLVCVRDLIIFNKVVYERGKIYQATKKRRGLFNIIYNVENDCGLRVFNKRERDFKRHFELVVN